MPKTKVLVVSVSAGYGHIVAAEALLASAHKYFAESVDISHIDLISVASFPIRLAYKDGYNFVVDKCPEFWGYMYKRTNHDRAEGIIAKTRKYLEGKFSEKLFDIINKIKPDHIICTHFLPAYIISGRSDKIHRKTPVWMTITDFMAHQYWLVKGLAGYFTACDEEKQNMGERGINTDLIRVTGIPVMPAFSEEYARNESADKFGIPAGKKTILVMGGAEGIGGMDGIVKELLAMEGDFQTIVLAGRNRKLYSDLLKIAEANPGKLYPQSFTNEVYHLLNASDLIISKPGGLTTSECMAMGKPRVVISPIPGQEESNADIICGKGAAVRAYDLGSLKKCVDELMRNDKKLERMARNAKQFGKPHAAGSVLQEILGSNN